MKKKKESFGFSNAILILIIWASAVHAQSGNSDSTDNYFDLKINEIGNQLNYGFDDAARLFGGISDFDNTDLIYSTALVLGTTASFALDKEMKNIASRNQNSASKSLTNIGEEYGIGLYSVLLSAGLFTTGLITDNKEIMNTGRILAEALIVSGITVQIIKIVSGRSRPFLEEGPFKFKFFKTDNPHNSFPSGHTVAAFTTSSVLAATIKNTYASIALYSLAGLTAYQRIYSNNHWFSDTVVAAVIGTVVGNVLVRINNNRFNDIDCDNRVGILPGIDQFGVNLNFSIKL